MDNCDSSENVSVKHNLHSNDTQAGAIQAGAIPETQVTDQNRTLGLAKSSVGRRRSKSSDGRIRGHAAAANTSDICATTAEHRNIGSVDGASSESKTQSESLLVETATKPGVPVIGTYKLSEPAVVDRLTNIETDWREKWATGSNVLDYALVNVVEKIRLRTVADDPNDPDDEDRSNEIVFETTPVTDCPEEQNDGDQSEDRGAQSSHEAQQFDSQPGSREDVQSDKQQRSTCPSEVPDENVHHGSDKGREMQVTAEEIEPSNDTGESVNQPISSTQSRDKEDQDSEEKEEDEAEIVEAESDDDEETEEKGALELTVEKSAGENSADTATTENVERLNRSSTAEPDVEVTHDDRRDSNEDGERRETAQDVVGDPPTATNDHTRCDAQSASPEQTTETPAATCANDADENTNFPASAAGEHDSSADIADRRSSTFAHEVCTPARVNVLETVPSATPDRRVWSCAISRAPSKFSISLLWKVSRTNFADRAINFCPQTQHGTR